MIKKQNIKKILASLFCVNMLLACALFASCDHSPEDEETTTEETTTTPTTTEETTTYTGSGLVTFLGTGSLNTDGDVEVTPDGWNTSSTLGTSLTVANLKSITVNAKLSDTGYQGSIKLIGGSEDNESVYANVTETSFSDVTVDISSCTATTLSDDQFFIMSTTDWSATTDKTITIHSITIKNK